MKNIPNRVSIDINVKVYPIKNLEKIRLSHKSHIYKINECYLEQYKFFAIDFLKAENKVFVQILIEKKCLSVWWIQCKQIYSSVFSLYNFVFELSLPELGNSDQDHCKFLIIILWNNPNLKKNPAI